MIDFFSDTNTKPSSGMRKAMAAAEVGNSLEQEDPSENKLIERVLNLAKKQDAIFLPSGTMANLISMLVHCRPGD